jgi:transposase
MCVGLAARCPLPVFPCLTDICRRIATRYDKLVANYRAFVKLAVIRIWTAL